LSFKKKRIPHELILKDSEWEQPYEKHRWLLWSVAALLCAGLLSFVVVLSLFNPLLDSPSTAGSPTEMRIEDESSTRIVVPLNRQAASQDATN